MRMATLTEAERELEDLDVHATTLRRRALRGEYPYILVGTRMLVDVDILRPLIEREQAHAGKISIRELSDATGLKVSAIRRGVREGWLPGDKERGKMLFDLAAVQDALLARMEGGKAAAAGGQPKEHMA